MPIIYKILPEAMWLQAQKDRVFRGSEVDLRDGFIHFSTASQAVETAAKHFVYYIVRKISNCFFVPS